MDFPDALKACINGEKIRRPHWGKSVNLSELQTINPMDSLCDILAVDWEVIEDIPEAKPEDWKVIPKYQEWLDKNIRESCGCVESGHVYYVQCMEKLNELLYKQQTIWRGEKCERLIVSLSPRYGNSEIVSRRIPAYKPTLNKTPERCTIMLINGNKATVKTESGGYMIIKLPSVEL
jgi:hypothetical protein